MQSLLKLSYGDAISFSLPLGVDRQAVESGADLLLDIGDYSREAFLILHLISFSCPPILYSSTGGASGLSMPYGV